MTSGALLSRMNFAVSLAQNRVPGITVDLGRVLAGAGTGRSAPTLERLLSRVLPGEPRPESRAVLSQLIGRRATLPAPIPDRGTDGSEVEMLAAMVLGSPEFQRR